ncbi:unnamed protein product [Mytilus coruscus]|uniref:Uncharacterized protein n=1 Tax=Mytilus coruscus TaxID=42192 RepID=A0A6J8A710_MYTCO|nr:unnamed protein product [Mytilus coruscus]
MTETQRAQWLLSMPSCADVNTAMQNLTGIKLKVCIQTIPTICFNAIDEEDTHEDNQSEIVSIQQTRKPSLGEEVVITLGGDTICESGVLDDINARIAAKRKGLEVSRTASLWMRYSEMVNILKRFIKAERTGNWELHLQTLQDMLPYFAAAGHNVYAKSAYVYISMMQTLQQDHPDIYRIFLEGYHVFRRSDRYWAGLSTDLVIEEV